MVVRSCKWTLDSHNWVIHGLAEEDSANISLIAKENRQKVLEMIIVLQVLIHKAAWELLMFVLSSFSSDEGPK